MLAGAALVAATAPACAADPPAATVGLTVRACDPGDETGSGMTVAPGIALTSAHVVAGAREITVRHATGTSPGEIVGFDPEMDLAYVAFDGPSVRVPEVDSTHVVAGDRGDAWVVRDGEFVRLDVRVERRVTIRTEDIYIEGETLRPGYELDADIRLGDSGGVVTVDGDVIGVIWARSRQRDRRAYAIDPSRAGALISEQRSSGELGDVDITRC